MKLTNAADGQKVHVAAHHVVLILERQDHTEIVMSHEIQINVREKSRIVDHMRLSEMRYVHQEVNYEIYHEVSEEEPTKHDWIKSTLGHGEQMCSRCLMTNREAAVLGVTDECVPSSTPAQYQPTGDER